MCQVQCTCSYMPCPSLIFFAGFSPNKKAAESTLPNAYSNLQAFSLFVHLKKTLDCKAWSPPFYAKFLRF